MPPRLITSARRIGWVVASDPSLLLLVAAAIIWYAIPRLIALVQEIYDRLDI